MSGDVLDEQRRYYAARAPEYDDWWFRRGRYALDAAAEAAWTADISEVEASLHAFRPAGVVLELAAGTGLWTRRLVETADRVVAVDANIEVLELNRARVSGPVEYVVADVFDWRPEEAFDVCFFGFWLSHVPEARFAEFWALVRSTLRPGGRVFFVDSGVGDSAHTRVEERGEREIRRLSDGREFEIVKRRWAPEELSRGLGGLGFDAELRQSRNGHFVYGAAS